MYAIRSYYETYLFEAANVRHEHEYRVWEHVPLPAPMALTSAGFSSKLPSSMALLIRVRFW